MGHCVLPLGERGLDRAHVEWRCVALNGMFVKRSGFVEPRRDAFMI